MTQLSRATIAALKVPEGPKPRRKRLKTLDFPTEAPVVAEEAQPRPNWLRVEPPRPSAFVSNQFVRSGAVASVQGGKLGIVWTPRAEWEAGYG